MADSDSHIIRDGDQIILRKEKDSKLFKIRKNRPIFMNKAKFSLAGAVGHPYGSTFEVKGGELVKIVKVSMTSTALDTSSGQDNRELQDKDANQKLSRDDIEALKGKGVRGEDLVQHIIENSNTFMNKTEYSQEKYIKKKKKKHLQIYTILKPSTRFLFEMYYNRGPSKVCYMRLDTLSQILNQCNVHAGVKMMLFEGCQGVLLGAVMERMGGVGTLVQFYNGTAPVRGALEGYDFPSEFFRNVYCYPLNMVNSVKVQENAAEGMADSSADSKATSDSPIDSKVAAEPSANSKTTTDSNSADNQTQVKMDVESDQSKNADEKVGETVKQEEECSQESADLEETSHKKPKLDETVQSSSKRCDRKEKRTLERQKAKEILQQGQMDGLIVAGKLHPTSIVMKLVDFVMPSRPVVVYCQYKEPLVDCYMKLRKRGGVINLRLTETWYREQQVLPQRTHPTITMSGSGGFLLTGLVVAK